MAHTPQTIMSDPAGSNPFPIVSGRDGDRRWWRVADDRVEMTRSSTGWDARVERAGWGGLALDLVSNGGHFAEEAEALAWCQRMVDVLMRDAQDCQN